MANDDTESTILKFIEPFLKKITEKMNLKSKKSKIEKSISDDEKSGKNDQSGSDLSGILEEWIELLIRYKKFLNLRDLRRKTE